MDARTKACLQLGDVRSTIEAIRIAMPSLPARTAGAVDAHLLTAFDSIAAASGLIADVPLTEAEREQAEQVEARA